MIRHALRYALIGWPVFPLAPRDKIPLISKKEGGNGAADATTDPDRIAEWWKRSPNSNIGVTLPKLLAVDVDPRNSGDVTWDRLCHANGEPETLVQQTGSGGLHYIFRRPDFPTWAKRQREYPGIDIITGHHRYILVAPSVHPVTGLPYRWIRRMQPQPLPDWLLALVRREPESRHVGPYDVRRSQSKAFERARRYLHHCPVAISGNGGHQTTFSLCLKLVENFAELDGECLWTLLQDWNVRCQPPWNNRDLRHKLDSALRSVRERRSA